MISCVCRIQKFLDFNNSTNASSSYVHLHLVHDYDDNEKLFFGDQDQSFLQNLLWVLTPGLEGSLTNPRTKQPRIRLALVDHQLNLVSMLHLFVAVKQQGLLLMKQYHPYPAFCGGE
ncbi:hypothetical protein L1987_44804 [Smallanthus sonchifolius]|uniref:Uncharacterized protein n=1 Tax=Smallanthus sonchifolius TaxID=185202 RepID=A0ACB9GRH1_9ASTR|nr:hypothetical protein L1987_44804 [Smallanthus sonchifolius]